MQGGDISNATSPRLIVMADAVVVSEVETKHRRLRPDTSKRVIVSLNAAALSHLWRMSNRFGLSVELAAMESDLWTQELLDKLMSRLDKRGTNPFNYAEVYESTAEFLSDIPYRSDLQGVVDLPQNVARYGSWGLELQNLGV